MAFLGAAEVVAEYPKSGEMRGGKALEWGVPALKVRGGRKEECQPWDPPGKEVESLNQGLR